MYQDSQTLCKKSECPYLPVNHMWKAPSFGTVHLLQLTGPKVFILLKLKRKCYFNGWHTLRREDCIASVAQPTLGLLILGESKLFKDVYVFTALCNNVTVQCVCGSNKMYTPTTVFVHNEIMCTFVSQSTYIMYRKNGNKHKVLKLKTMQGALVKKVY